MRNEDLAAINFEKQREAAEEKYKESEEQRQETLKQIKQQKE